MKGSKRIIDLITDETIFKAGCINIIEANVSAGKTYFALNALPAWAGTPEKVLYLIDTTNGELSIQRHSIAIGRLMYSFYDYNTKKVWGEGVDKMPVMTYAGFAAEVMKDNAEFKWLSGFKYIVCDEMQNLVHYR